LVHDLKYGVTLGTGWLPPVGALTVLIDGFVMTLFLLHRWLGRRSRQIPLT
jgi:hypothetical protein